MSAGRGPGEPPKFNRQPWNEFARRFQTGGYSFFRRFFDSVVPTINLGTVFPDGEEVLYMGAGESLNAVFPTVPTVTVTPGRTPIAVQWLAVKANIGNFDNTNKIAYWCLALGSSLFNPFGAAFGGFFPPQFRPLLDAQSLNFVPSGALMAVGRATASPSIAVRAFEQIGQRVQASVLAGASYSVVHQFNPPLVIPPLVTLALVTTQAGSAADNPLPKSLTATIGWRELT